MHAFMVELDQPETIGIQENLEIREIYVQSNRRVVLSLYHRFWQFRLLRAEYKTLLNLFS